MVVVELHVVCGGVVLICPDGKEIEMGDEMQSKYLEIRMGSSMVCPLALLQQESSTYVLLLGNLPAGGSTHLGSIL